MLCHPEPGSVVNYALQNAKSPYTSNSAEGYNSVSIPYSLAMEVRPPLETITNAKQRNAVLLRQVKNAETEPS